MKAMTRLFVMVLLAGMVSFGCGGSGGGSDPVPGPGPEETYDLTGTITISGGAALPGVTMTLSGAGSGTAMTDASGNYSFTGLANGSYTVTPSLAGYTFDPTNQAVTISGANVPLISFTATVNPNPTYSISGTITKSGGGALSGVTMTLSGAGSGTAMTDASGNYTFSGLADGSYTVTPSPAGYTFNPISKPVTISGANVPLISFTATANPDPTYSISGTITMSTGGALSGVTMKLSGAGSGTATTNGSGNYTFSGLANGSYTVTPSPAGYTFTPTKSVVKISGADVPLISFTATLIIITNPTYSISGTITMSTGGALSGVTMTLSGAGSGTAKTNGSGNYTFSGLGSGSYTVTPSPDGYTFNPISKQVTISGANVTSISFTAIDDHISALLKHMVSIPAGSFMMGSADDQYEQARFMTPVHQVILPGFDIGAYEVTQAQYFAVMGTNPSAFNGPGNENNPVEQVSWYEARAFCTALSAMTGRTFTLPSEAQWEYACRAGTTTLYSYGSSDALLGNYAWWNSNSESQTHPVGTKLPNPWGLYDMHGNVWEWCLDSWHTNYDKAPKDGSAWEPNTGDYRILRGGSWTNLSPWEFQSMARTQYNFPDYKNSAFGFRVIALPKVIDDLLNSMVSIPAGTFTMGSMVWSDEMPPHDVTLQAFDIGAYEVTQAQYQAIMGVNPSYCKAPTYPGSDNRPVEQINWYEAREFCTKLSDLTGRTFTLPSEAQWEYACRAGSTTLYSYGDSDTMLGDYAWWYPNSYGTGRPYGTHPVGTKLSNNWGLYDMMGNVWEWCLDSWHTNYDGAPKDGSAWEPETGDNRMFRGGSLITEYPVNIRSASRFYDMTDSRCFCLGFRVIAVRAPR